MKKKDSGKKKEATIYFKIATLRERNLALDELGKQNIEVFGSGTDLRNWLHDVSVPEVDVPKAKSILVAQGAELFRKRE